MYVWRSRSGSNQPEALSIEYPSYMEQPVHAKVTKKVKPIKKKKLPSTKNVNTSSVPLDSPSMCTRSKKIQPPNPATSTRSKRRLSLWCACSVCVDLECGLGDHLALHVLYVCTWRDLAYATYCIFAPFGYCELICELRHLLYVWTLFEYDLNLSPWFQIIMYVCTWSVDLYAFEMVVWCRGQKYMKIHVPKNILILLVD